MAKQWKNYHLLLLLFVLDQVDVQLVKLGFIITAGHFFAFAAGILSSLIRTGIGLNVYADLSQKVSTVMLVDLNAQGTAQKTEQQDQGKK